MSFQIGVWKDLFALVFEQRMRTEGALEESKGRVVLAEQQVRKVQKLNVLGVWERSEEARMLRAQ